jgi:hypothetical protein
MTDTVSSEFQFTADGPDSRFSMPPPIQGKARLVALFPMLFGLIFMGAAVLWVALALDSGPGFPEIPAGVEVPQPPAPPPGPGFADYLFAAFATPFLLIGLATLFFSLGILFPRRTTLLLSGGRLIATRGFGPLRRRRQLDLETLTQLETYYPRPSPNPPVISSCSLAVRTRDGHSQKIAAGYKPPVIEALATALSAELTRRGFAVPTVAASGSSEAMPPVDAPLAESVPEANIEAEAPLSVPAGTRIQHVSVPGAVTFLIPRSGFRGAAGFFLLFSLIWNGISWTIFSVFFIVFLRSRQFSDFFPLLFLCLFLAVGVATALATVQLAFRTSVLLATPDSLVFTQKGPLRSRERQWPRATLLAIGVGDSSTSVNGRALPELQIHAAEGGKLGMFDGHPDEDLAWMASTLRAFYGLPARPRS